MGPWSEALQGVACFWVALATVPAASSLFWHDYTGGKEGGGGAMGFRGRGGGGGRRVQLCTRLLTVAA